MKNCATFIVLSSVMVSAIAAPIQQQQQRAQPIEPTEAIVPLLDGLNLESASDEPVIRKARTLGLLNGLLGLGGLSNPFGNGWLSGFGGYPAGNGYPAGYGGYPAGFGLPAGFGFPAGLGGAFGGYFF